MATVAELDFYPRGGQAESGQGYFMGSKDRIGYTFTHICSQLHIHTHSYSVTHTVIHSHTVIVVSVLKNKHKRNIAINILVVVCVFRNVLQN